MTNYTKESVNDMLNKILCHVADNWWFGMWFADKIHHIVQMHKYSLEETK